MRPRRAVFGLDYIVEAPHVPSSVLTPALRDEMGAAAVLEESDLLHAAPPRPPGHQVVLVSEYVGA